MTPYQQFIAKSKYARYLPEKQRREHWSETVDRYFDYMTEKVSVDVSLLQELKSAVLNREVMPSMRLLMTAGPAARVSSVSGYNCSYTAIDDQKAFDEIMYVLMNGTGVGFSVEQRHVKCLPEVPEELFDCRTTIVVHDSKEGWAKAYRQLIALLYSGEIPKWDLSAVRLAGAPLKTFGGRASGPDPLEDLFLFTIKTFKEAKGRKLSSLECHDIVCKIAEIVIVGSTRRSALISLSNLSDQRIAKCKSGQWWVDNNQRRLANNSAVYREKPDASFFLEEWKNLIDSNSGERGIFNHVAVKNILKKIDRHYDEAMATNPCGEIILNNKQFCNLTTVVIKPSDTQEDLKRKIRLASILGTYQASLTNFPYLRRQWRNITEKEALLGVSMTGIYDNPLTYDMNDSALPSRLEELRSLARKTNEEFAPLFGVNISAAITAIKPEGTVSQLCGASSGIHPQHSRYYIRSVRGDNKDPLTQFLKDSGIKWEPCISKPESTTVFFFPVKAAENAVLRDDLSAVEHLELWKVYQNHYCEHKPSITVSVKKDEWLDVGAWVWKNWDVMTGVAFLPYDGGSYRQAPYTEIDEDTYIKELDNMQSVVLEWDKLSERTDNVEGAQQLACSSGFCEI